MWEFDLFAGLPPAARFGRGIEHLMHLFGASDGGFTTARARRVHGCHMDTPWIACHICGMATAQLLCGAIHSAVNLGLMVRGPAPTPKHILALRGSPEAKRREELGTPVTELPAPPDWLRPAAKAMFTLVCGYTQRMGSLAESDTQVIARYAIVWDKWQEAEKNLAKTGECWKEVLAPDGSLRFCRPSKWQAQSNHCHEQLRQLETVLGLTPADRTRLGYGAVKVVSDPVDALFDDAAG